MHKVQGHILVRRRARNGLDGCIVRTTVWLAKFRYHNDEHLTSGTRYLDIALVWNETLNDYERYKCIKTHDSSLANKPTGKDYTKPWGEFWRRINEMSPIYSPLIMADNALLKFTQTNQLLVMKSDNSTVAAGMGGGDYPLWVGAVTPDNAPFRVGIDGKLTAIGADITGTIKTKDGFIGAFKIDGNGLSNISENPLAFINISAPNGRFFNVNVGESYMCAIRADFKTALHAQCYGNGSVAISALTNGSTKDSVAIQSFGNVELTARDGETIKVRGLCIQSRIFADFSHASEKVIKSNDDFLLIQATQNDIIINLPDIYPGKILFIKKIGSKKVTLKGDIRKCDNAITVNSFELSEASHIFIQEDSPSSAFTKPTWCYYHCG